jgi:predicted nucleic acid-binding Zn ribbon protein
MSDENQIRRYRRGLRSTQRTLARLAVVARDIPAEALAQFLFPRLRSGYVHGLADYLSDVREFLGKLEPKRQCVGCGCGLYKHARTDTQYCSPKCRQKAYRKKARYGSRRQGEDRGVTSDGSSGAGDGLAVTAGGAA